MTKDKHEEHMTDTETPNTDKAGKKGPSKKLLALMGATGLFLCGALLLNMNQDPLANEEVALEDFQTFPERDVVVVDQGMVEHDDALADFIEEHYGQEGLHLYENEETGERFAYISGAEGMEPLAMMLYGIVDASEEEVVIGYNYVEASPRFQHTVPSILLSIEAEAETEINGRLIIDETSEHPDDILQRFEDDGFEPMSEEELEEVDEDEWNELDSADETEVIEADTDD